MTNPMPDRLTEILDGLQARLEGGLRGNRAAVTHPGARGEASEEDWLRVLNDHLPRRYQADRAFVIDSRGECSDQIDIVIYDREYSPFLYNQANQRYVPAESVYGILEVKQDLTREHLLYAGAKAASVRRLHRTSAPIPYAEGAYKPRPLPRIVAGIVTYQSSWVPPFGEPFRNALAELPADYDFTLLATDKIAYAPPGITREELERLRKDAIKKFYLRPKIILRYFRSWTSFVYAWKKFIRIFFSRNIIR